MRVLTKLGRVDDRPGVQAGSEIPDAVPKEHLPFLRILGQLLATWAARDPRFQHLRRALERASAPR